MNRPAHPGRYPSPTHLSSKTPGAARFRLEVRGSCEGPAFDVSNREAAAEPNLARGRFAFAKAPEDKPALKCSHMDCAPPRRT